MDNINYYVSLDLGSDSMVAAFYDPTDIESRTRLIPLQERAFDYVRAPGRDDDTSVKPQLERENNKASCRLRTRISLTDNRQPQQIEPEHAALDAVADAAAGRRGAQPQSIFRFFHVRGGVILQNKLMPNPKIPFQLGAREVFPRVRARGGGSDDFVTLAPDVLLQHLTSQVLRSFVLPAQMLKGIEDPARSVCLLLTVPNVYSVTHKQALREFLQEQNIVGRVEIVCESDAVAYSVFGELDSASPAFQAFKANLRQKFNRSNQRLLTIDVGRGTTDLSYIEWENAAEGGQKRRHNTLAREGISEGGNTVSHILARYYQGRIRGILAAQGHELPFDLLSNRPADNAGDRAKALQSLERLIEAVKRGFKADLTNETPVEVQQSWLKDLAKVLTDNLDFSRGAPSEAEDAAKRAWRRQILGEDIADLQKQQKDPLQRSARNADRLAEWQDQLEQIEIEDELLPNISGSLYEKEFAQQSERLTVLAARQRRVQMRNRLQQELLLPTAPPPVADAPAPAADTAPPAGGLFKRIFKMARGDGGGPQVAAELAVGAGRAVAAGVQVVRGEIESARLERERMRAQTRSQAALQSTMSDFTREIETWEELLQEIRAHVRRSVTDLIDKTFATATNTKKKREDFFENPHKCWVLVAGQASQFAPLQQEIENALNARKIPADQRLFLTGPPSKHACCLGAIEYVRSATEIIDKDFFGTLAIATPLTAVDPGESPLRILDESAFTDEGCISTFNNLAWRQLYSFSGAPPENSQALDISKGTLIAQTLGESNKIHVCYDSAKSRILFDGKPTTVPTYGDAPKYIWSQVWPDMLPLLDQIADDEEDEFDAQGTDDENLDDGEIDEEKLWEEYVPEPSAGAAPPPLAAPPEPHTVTEEVVADGEVDADVPLSLPPASLPSDDGWDEVDNAVWELPEIPLPPTREDSRRGRRNRRR